MKLNLIKKPITEENTLLMQRFLKHRRHKFQASYLTNWLLAWALSAGCSFLVPDPYDADLKSKKYRISARPSGWTSINPDKSDFAFSNPKSGSIIMINSICKKYSKTPLRVLSLNMLDGVENLDVKSSRDVPFRSRTGNHIYATGQMDGVPVHLNLFSYRKDRCTYDFVLIATNKSGIPKSDKKAFDTLLSATEFGDE